MIKDYSILLFINYLTALMQKLRITCLSWSMWLLRSHVSQWRNYLYFDRNKMKHWDDW